MILDDLALLPTYQVREIFRRTHNFRNILGATRRVNGDRHLFEWGAHLAGTTAALAPGEGSAGWQPAVSPTGSRLAADFFVRLRIGNPRYLPAPS